MGERKFVHIYPNLLYRPAVLPLPYTELLQFFRDIFRFLYQDNIPMVCREFYQRRSWNAKRCDSSPYVPLERRRQKDGNGEFFCRSFPSVESVHKEEENVLPTSSS